MIAFLHAHTSCFEDDQVPHYQFHKYPRVSKSLIQTEYLEARARTFV